MQARVLALTEGDDRVVDGKVVGSLATGGGDRFSDLDLTFAVVDGTPVAHVLEDWSRTFRSHRRRGTTRRGQGLRELVEADTLP